MASSPPTTLTPPDPSLATDPPIPALRPNSPADPDPRLLVAGATVGDGASLSRSEGCHGLLPPLKLLPPSDRLPPNFRPQIVSDASQAPAEKGWVEVGGRHRPRLEKPSALPRKKKDDHSLAFKQRSYGLCFRCLAEDHFVADCRGPVTCLGCGHSSHRKRDCLGRLPASQGRLRRSMLPPYAPGLPNHEPPTSSQQLQQRSWAAVVASPMGLVQEALCSNSGVSWSGLSDPGKTTFAVDLGLLQPLFAAQTKTLRAELQALVTARVEEVVQPLRDMAVTLQGWAAWVSGLLERLEDTSDAGVAGCSSEVLATVALPVDVPPPSDLALHRMVTQGEEAQAKVAEKVRGTDDMERTEVSLPVGLVGEVPPLVSSPGMTASEGSRI
ncbi:hypothetical protein VPH35_050364 [Triticum aestivum]|uniref:CCHC-type domain-containing protein n=2 Tax=Triticum TaxID=4564 RepID=A0A9R1RYQ6_TRITD|nr:unnamed protein product [Triticum aestivum]VAH73461.1 unnamed protein product [Triticum turgidum subsp. durum]